MDQDLSQLLGIRNDPEEALAMKELARRANDSLRIYNPTKEDYRVAVGLYDEVTPGGYFLVPGSEHDIGYGKGQNVHPRFVAFKFFKEITNIILDAEMQYAIQTENKKREKNGQAPLDKTFDKAEELKFVYAKGVNIDRPEKLMELLPKIILGVEREWGMEALPYQKREDVVNWSDVLKIVDRPVNSGVSQATDSPEGHVEPVEATNSDEVLKGVVA